MHNINSNLARLRRAKVLRHSIRERAEDRYFVRLITERQGERPIPVDINTL
ncbi:hypothetical protein [Pseudomonas putida]